MTELDNKKQCTSICTASCVDSVSDKDQSVKFQSVMLKPNKTKSPFDIKRVKDKVCIVGCSDSKILTPFNDPSFEFWGVNNLFLTFPDKPWSRWFEIHTITYDGQHFRRRDKLDFRGMAVDKYLDYISKLKCPVYMQQSWPNIPNSIPYPKQEIINKFGNYFTNTITWMIGLAILIGFKTIEIHGVDMAVGTEYEKQRPSCEWLIGYMQAAGIKYHIPDEADLMKTRFLYGFEENKEDAWMKKVNCQIQSMHERMNHAIIKKQNLEREIKHCDDQINQYVGAIQGSKEQLKIWGSCLENKNECV